MLITKAYVYSGELQVGENVTLRANKRLSVKPNVGDEIAVWTIGDGTINALRHLGIVSAVDDEVFPDERSAGEHEEWLVSAKLTASSVRPITLDEIRPFRDSDEDTLQAGLARCGYYQAHRKVQAAPDGLARQLRERFL